MPSIFPELPSFHRVFRAFAGIALVAAVFAATGCKPAINGDMYSLASERPRVISPALIAPGSGGEYAFTIESVPTVEIVSTVSGATVWYTIDGGEYRAYAGPFALSVADPMVDQTITVAAYLSHPRYRSSEPVTQVYRFVATAVPSPSISASEEPTSYHFYYHYDALPTISATCPLASATIRYSLDGSDYVEYTGPFTLPVSAGSASIETHTLSMFASAEGYANSPVTSESFRFAKNGAIVTIAGTGTAGFAGDGGNARSALFNLPESVSVGRDGTVYVSDSDNDRVRAIVPDGTVNTIAGNGAHLYWTGTGPAESSSLAKPTSLALDHANNVLYVVDQDNFRVMAITLDDGNIRRFTGVDSGGSDANLTARLSGAIGPRALWFMSEGGGGTLFIADSRNNRVWEVDADIAVDSPLTHVAGGDANPSPADGSSALLAQLYSTFGLCADSGNIYLAAMTPGIIYRVERATSNIYTLCSGLYGPWQPWIDDTGLYFSVSYYSQVWRFGTLANTLMTGSLSGLGVDPSTEVEGAMPGTASLTAPKGICVVPGDGIFVADTGNNRIRKVILY